MRLKEGESLHEDIPTVPTGSIGLDIALGTGGYPRGRIVRSTGPSRVARRRLRSTPSPPCSAKGGLAAYIDAEHALDPEYAKKSESDIDNLFISQPDSGEQALEICDQLVRIGALDIIVINSVAALVPKAEIEGEMGDSTWGCRPGS